MAKTERFEFRLTEKEAEIVRTKSEKLNMNMSEFARLCVLNSNLMNMVNPPLTLTLELQIIEGQLKKHLLTEQGAKNCAAYIIRKYMKKESEHGNGVN